MPVHGAKSTARRPVGAAPPRVAKAPAGSASAPKRRPAPVRESAAKWAEQVGATRATLEPVGAYFPQSGVLPKLPDGATMRGFDEAQVRYLHRAYWTAAPGADLNAVIAAAQKDSVFADHGKIDRKAVGRMFAQLGDSFPWDWASRNVVFGSHALIDALQVAPKGSSVAKTIAELQRKHPGFPTQAAFSHHATHSWRQMPERFPFTKVLDRHKGRFVLEAKGAEAKIDLTAKGQFAATEKNAAAVAALMADKRVRYEWQPDDLITFVAEQLGVPFKRKSFYNLRGAFPEIVPTFLEGQRERLEAMCTTIKALHDDGEVNATRLLARLHSEHGYPEYSLKQLRYFRTVFPELVPDFKAAKSEASAAKAQALLQQIQKRPGDTYLDVAADLGHSEAEAKYLIKLIHQHSPGALPKLDRARVPYDSKDVAALMKAMDSAPIGASPADVYAALEVGSPRYIERHPLADPGDISVVASRVLKLDGWGVHQQRRLAKLMIEANVEAKPGATFAELLDVMKTKHAVAYPLHRVRDMQSAWRRDPGSFPEIAQLLDSHGRFPWDYTGVKGRVAAAQAVSSFAELYPASSVAPAPPDGEDVDGYGAPQLAALHSAYWSVPPQASIDDLVAHVAKDPAFRGKKAFLDKKRIGGVFSKLRDSFPWPWRSRSVTFASYVFVNALLDAPKGTSATKVVARLQKAYRGFPSLTNFTNAAKASWVSEPERFSFAAALPTRKDGTFVLEAQGEVEGFERYKGKLVTNDLLASAVAEIGRASVGVDTKLSEFAAHVNEETGGPFTAATFKRLRSLYPKLLPSYNELLDGARARLAQTVHELHTKAGVGSATEMLAVLKKEHAYDLAPQDLSRLREKFPDLVPNFKDSKRSASVEEAKVLLDAIKADPSAAYRDTAATLGITATRSSYLLSLIREEWPDALEDRSASTEPYTAADRTALAAALQEVPIGGSVKGLRRALQGLAPDFFERHPMTNSHLARVVRRELGVESWHGAQQARLEQLVVDVCARSPAGMSLRALSEFLQDEHGVEYRYSYLRELQLQWKKHPEAHPVVAALADGDGHFPWDRRTVRATKTLAKRVGDLIRSQPGLTLSDYAVALSEDPGFASKYPTFSGENIHYLRAKFPDQVPFVDELQVSGRASRIAAWAKKRATLADRAEEAAAKMPGKRSVRALAAKLKVTHAQLLAAVHEYPERFGWVRQMPGGKLDIELATRVAHFLESAPPGTTKREIVAALRADPAFAKAHPGFGETSFLALRNRYPELVPNLQHRDEVLRSKILVDAIRTAKKGASFDSVVRGLGKTHPGVFEGRWADAQSVTKLWRSDPARFELAQAVKSGSGFALTGRGERLPPSDETAGRLATRLARFERIPDRLPIIDALTDSLHKNFFRNFEMVAVQHIFESQVPAIDAYRKCGLSAERASIIAVPYSASMTAVDALADKGWDVEVPPLDLKVWLEDVREALYERLESAKASGRRVIVLDDGGLVSKLLHTDPHLKQHADLFSVVEQTRRGITVADGIEALATPVVNVAQSWGKYVEGPMIGRSVEDKLVSRLEKMGISSVAGKKVGVIGYGTIGEPIARALAELGAEVTILDADPAQQARAEEDGFAVAKGRKGFFGGQKVIIGATGVQSMSAEDLAHLKKGTVIGSASSKLVEIDVQGLESMAGGSAPEIIDGESHPPTVRYHLPGGKHVDLLAKGFPLNFDGEPENIPPEQIQLTRALMMIGAIQAASARVAGVTRLDRGLQGEVLEALKSLAPFAKDNPQLEEALGGLAAGTGKAYRRKS